MAMMKKLTAHTHPATLVRSRTAVAMLALAAGMAVGGAASRTQRSPTRAARSTAA
jgi:hypothetical protein